MKKNIKRFFRKLNRNISEIHYKLIIVSMIFCISFTWTFPQHSLAHELEEVPIDADNVEEFLNEASIYDVFNIFKADNTLPQVEEREPYKKVYISITAYNSEPGQTDSTPCITANGFNVCEHGIEDTIAANFLPFGTKVRMPELFGNRVFIVRDRMNARYYYKADIWMKDKQDARNFGIKYTEIEVY